MYYLFNIIYLLVMVRVTICDDLINGESNSHVVYIKLYHNFNINSDYDFRGLLTITGNNLTPNLKQEPLTIESIAKLKQTSSDGGYYYLKAEAVKCLEDDKPMKTSTTFIKACSLYESSLSDTLTVTLDINGQFLSLSAVSSNPQCISTTKNTLATKLTTFNSTVNVLSTSVAVGYVSDICQTLSQYAKSQTIVGRIGPDTQTYIQRLEQEKAEKLHGDKTDNRSFFAKYWMYIVPVVIFLLISGAANPDSQAGGAQR